SRRPRYPPAMQLGRECAAGDPCARRPIPASLHQHFWGAAWPWLRSAAMVQAHFRSLARALPAAILLWSATAAIGCAARRDKKDATQPGESQADKHYDVAVGSFHNGMYADAKLQI